MPHYFSPLPSRLRLAVLLVLILLGAKHASRAQQPGLGSTLPLPPAQANTGGLCAGGGGSLD